MLKGSRQIEEAINNAFDFGVIAVGSGLLSGILLLTPAKSVGYIGLGASTGSFLITSVAKKKLLKSGQEVINKNNQELLKAIDEKEQLQRDYAVLQSKQEKVLELGNQALQLQEELESVKSQLDAKNSKLAELEQSLGKALSDNRINLGAIQNNAIDCLKERKTALEQVFEGLTNKIGADKLARHSDDNTEIFTRYTKAIKKAKSAEEICDLVLGGVDDLANVKIRAIKSQNLDNIQKLLAEITELEEINKEWTTADLVPKSELTKLRKNCEAQLKEFHFFAKNEISDIMTQADSLNTQMNQDEEFFKLLRNQIAEYETKLAESMIPHRFPGTHEQARVGNDLINHFHKSRLILDAIDWINTELGYKLLFHFGRNGRYVPPNELHELCSREQLKMLTGSLSLPEFKQSESGGHLYLEVQKTAKKKSANSDIKRLLMEPALAVAKIISAMSHKPTIRIMGATGEGKGVMARYLLSQILSQLKWYARLHDPQDGSEQDHWNIPKVSKSGNELKEALVSIEAQMKEREANKNWQTVTLDILDEIDTHLESKEKKESFITLCSRIRHCGMKLILIGQNPKVGRAGFEWSDMQQMTCIYMGASAYDAILANKQLQPKKDKLSSEYVALSEHYETANEGLEDNEKFLFGLVVIPSKAPFWIELPRPDCIEVSQVKLLGSVGNSFNISNTIQAKYFRQSPADSLPLDPANGDPCQNHINAETTIYQELTENEIVQNGQKAAENPGFEGTVQSAKTAKTICKKHPSAELRPYSDGRYYCPSCKKKLKQSEIETEQS